MPKSVQERSLPQVLPEVVHLRCDRGKIASLEWRAFAAVFPRRSGDLDAYVRGKLAQVRAAAAGSMICLPPASNTMTKPACNGRAGDILPLQRRGWIERALFFIV
jgi:hypothetical protein